ncbi:Uncharacterized protein Fot_24631 [Forsythia ovata]|uniref:Uncharacterized protein n=1 Tax=Forsythia ovata TaxID=205694 RepID=A0ABD1U6S7_9LAMI
MVGVLGMVGACKWGVLFSEWLPPFIGRENGDCDLRMVVGQLVNGEVGDGGGDENSSIWSAGHRWHLSAAAEAVSRRVKIFASLQPCVRTFQFGKLEMGLNNGYPKLYKIPTSLCLPRGLLSSNHNIV